MFLPIHVQLAPEPLLVFMRIFSAAIAQIPWPVITILWRKKMMEAANTKVAPVVQMRMHATTHRVQPLMTDRAVIAAAHG
jgi:hypothetical protein